MHQRVCSTHWRAHGDPSLFSVESGDRAGGCNAYGPIRWYAEAYKWCRSEMAVRSLFCNGDLSTALPASGAAKSDLLTQFCPSSVYINLSAGNIAPSTWSRLRLTSLFVAELSIESDSPVASAVIMKPGVAHGDT